MTDTPSDSSSGSPSAHPGNDHLSQVPHAAAIGMTLHEYRDGACVVRVPYSEHLVGDPDTGVIHGGVITAVLDNASGMAVPREGLTPEQRSIATLDLRIDYMRPAVPHKDLMVSAECYQLTRSIAFVRATAWQEDDEKIIASSVATFMLGANRTIPPGFGEAGDGSTEAAR
ncbi:MAG TPA: PaaI family thioesterase [Pseudomonadales bacterium]|nr:PaaI family thioesterase [Pseudomonadales bacterium]